MSVPKIGYQNILLDGTLTASSEASTNPIGNLLDFRTDTNWTPSSVLSTATFTLNGNPSAANYLAIQGHNLGATNFDVKVQYYDGSTWVDTFRDASINAIGDVVADSPTDLTTWFQSQVTTTANQEIDLFGEVTLNKIDEVATTTPHYIYTTFYTSDLTSSFSTELKAGERGYGVLEVYSATDGSRKTIINLSTGEIISTDGTAYVTKIGDIYRVTMDITNSALSILSEARIGISTDGTTITYLGVVNNGIYAGNAQIRGGVGVVPFKIHTENNDIIFKTFPINIGIPNGSNDTWKIILTSRTTTNLPFISNLFLGTYWDMPTGFAAGHTPSKYMTGSRTTVSEGRNGAFLSRSVRPDGITSNVKLSNLTEADLIKWEAFRDHAEHKPFFISFDSDDVTDGLFAWTIRNPMTVHSTPMLFDATLNIKGLKN